MTRTEFSLGGSVRAYTRRNPVEFHRCSTAAQQASVARPFPQCSALKPYINSISGPSLINLKPQKPAMVASAVEVVGKWSVQ